MEEGDVEHAYSAEVHKRECKELELVVAEVDEAKFRVGNIWSHGDEVAKKTWRMYVVLALHKILTCAVRRFTSHAQESPNPIR
jgi:hypothetical protein